MKTYRDFSMFVLLFIVISHVAIAQENCVEQAGVFYRDGDYSAAVKAFESCPDSLNNAGVQEMYISSLFLSGNLADAWKHVAAIPDSSVSITAVSLKARIAFARGDYASAYHFYDRLNKSDSLNVTYIRQLAVCADKIDSTSKALELYTRALALNPDDLVTGTRLVEKYYLLDNFGMADYLSKQLLTRDSLPDLLRLRGDVLYRMKEYQEAYKCYEPLLRKGTINADLLRKAGICKFMDGGTEAAIEMLSVAHIIRPDDEITCYYLGMAYQSVNEYKKSILFFNGAINNGISQNIGVYYQRLAVVHESNGEYKKALLAYQSAMAYYEPESKGKLDMEFEIGRVYEVYLEDYRKAIQHYRQFLEAFADTADFKYKGVRARISLLEKRVK